MIVVQAQRILAEPGPRFFVLHSVRTLSWKPGRRNVLPGAAGLLWAFSARTAVSYEQEKPEVGRIIERRGQGPASGGVGLRRTASQVA